MKGAPIAATRARTALWGRLGDRVLFKPESDFPVVEGDGPGRTKVSNAAPGHAPPDSQRAKPLAEEDR